MILSKEPIELHPNLRVHTASSDAFKTATIKMFIRLPLDERATANALLMRVLSRGSRKYPTMRKISVFLNSLYGAVFGADISKIGESHIMELYFEFVSKRFLRANKDNTRKALSFLREILFRPLLGKGFFRGDFFAQEQVKLKDIIRSLYDDKIGYAEERCVQEMCRDEPYRIYDYGSLDDVDKLDPESVMEQYSNVVLKSSMDIFICAPAGTERVVRTISDIFNPTGKQQKTCPVIIPDTIVDKPVQEERLVKERQEIDQGKLVMGCRTYTTWKDRDIFALMMASGVLGGFPHSKLFRNVREKEGLAYYVSSVLEKTKGLMLVRAGINHDKFDKALAVIKEQVKALQQGDITDKELDDTRSGILNRLRAIEDNAASFIDYNMELRLNNRTDSLEELRGQFLGVSKDDIARAAQKIKIDTVYFLTI